MKRAVQSVLMGMCLMLVGNSLSAQRHMLKKYLFKVDPASALFKEFRVAIEHRIVKDYFAYLAPYGYHQSYLSRRAVKFGNPTNPQKYYGLGLRAGARRYLLPVDKSPEGLFLHVMGGYRHLWLQNMDDGLNITSRNRIHQYGLGATVGYQKLYGPWKKFNFAYGGMIGFEYYFTNVAGDISGGSPNLVENWYEFPFLGDFLPGFRFYLGVELGFAFLQKHLHW